VFGSQIGHLWPNCMAKGDLAQWHESSKILKVISGIPRGCFAWHASWGSAGDALTNTSHASNTQNAFSVWIWRKDVLLSWIHPIEDLSQHVALSYDKYLDVQIQELPTEDLCKTSPPAEKEASQAIVLNSFEHWLFLNKCIELVSEWQIHRKVMWAVAILWNCSTSFRPCTVSFPSSSTGACSDGADRSTKGGRGQKQCRFLFEISLHDQIL
jgi:hypothetical protein